MLDQPRKPMQIVEIAKPVVFEDWRDENLLDNDGYRFCADDPMADEATFEEFAINPNETLPEGTVVKIPYLWGWDAEGCMTEPKLYQLTLRKPYTLAQAVAVILTQYHLDTKSARYYFIEQASYTGGSVEVALGT